MREERRDTVEGIILQILLINNRVSEQTRHFTMESLILAQDER